MIFCPKCGNRLERRVFREQTYYYCNVCVRGFTEQHLQAIKEEIEVSIDFCDKVVENGRSC